MADKKARIRKAPSLREQAEASRSDSETRASDEAHLGIKLPRLGVFKFLRPVVRPLRWLVPRYFVNSWREVRQVTWPSRRETWRLTLAVFIFATVFGILIAGVDKGLDLLFKKLILKQ